MLEKRGLHDIQRWSSECRLDHETDLESYRKDLEALSAIFAAGRNGDFGLEKLLFQAGHKATCSIIDSIRWFEDAVQRGEMSAETAMNQVIGQGHHRVMAVRG
jgi:hypothetical protein